MINKYYNKLLNDFNLIMWDSRLNNKSGCPFPTIIDDILEVKSVSESSSYFVLYNRNNTGKYLEHRSVFLAEYALSIVDKTVITMFFNYKLGRVKAQTAKSQATKAMHNYVQIGKPIYEVRQHDYDKLQKSLTNSAKIHLNKFIEWCVKNGYCEKVRTKPTGIKSITDGVRRRKNKLPKEASLIALGDIFRQVIPEDESLWDTSPRVNHSDALSLTIVALSLSSPNRTMAEVRTLQKQNLIEYEDWGVLDKNGKPTLRYSLMWNGSKNYKDNENHILAPMGEVVKRALLYMSKVTKPFRILMQFWLKQDSTISDLFPTINKELQSRIEILKLTKSDKLTFVQLGFLLSFFDNETFKLKLKKTIEKEKKDTHVSELTADFQFYISGQSGGELIGFSKFSENASIITKGKLPLNCFISIGKLQEILFNTIKISWGSYPNLAVLGGASDNGSEIHICQAMWCLTGTSVGGEGGLYSPYLTKAMEGSFKNDLAGRLFRKYGFSERLRLSPNQLRHYLNHNGDINNIPHYVLNAWSGRKNSKHLQSYLHESAEDKIARIPIAEARIDLTDIKITSRKQYEMLRQKRDITSVTSVGFCTKDLRYTPCNYLSEFETQCTFCEQSCHVAHDESCITLLKEDYGVQCERLEKHLTAPKKNHEVAKLWFATHKSNTYLLSQLIEVLEDPSVPKGAIVRVITETREIRIADLEKKIISTRKLKLDNMHKDIQKGLQKLEYKKENSELDKETDIFLKNFWGDL
ncbi:hypothetical protein HJ025_19040 [Vibrio parahaemolyticus]|nr:hypothetical protein [Vibrio parahaemolyticus]